MCDYPTDMFTTIRDKFYRGQELDSREIGYLIDEYLRLDGLVNDLDIQLHNALGTATIEPCQPPTPTEESDPPTLPTTITNSTATTP